MEEAPAVVSSQRPFVGRIFSVRSDELKNAEGKTHRADVVEHGGSFAVVACDDAGRLVLVRQYRHPAGRFLWELPAGTAERGEDPVAGAARELEEETGYRARSYRMLGSIFMTPGFCDEVIYFVQASGLTAGEQSLDEDEEISIATFDLDEAKRLVLSGEIVDAKTLLALFWMERDGAELVPLRADTLGTR